MTEWVSCLERNPKPGDTVLVTSDSWVHPKVLRASFDGPHRITFVEPDNSRFYWYPERMHWMPIPPPPEESPQ